MQVVAVLGALEVQVLGLASPFAEFPSISENLVYLAK